MSLQIRAFSSLVLSHPCTYHSSPGPRPFLARSSPVPRPVLARSSPGPRPALAHPRFKQSSRQNGQKRNLLPRDFLWIRKALVCLAQVMGFLTNLVNVVYHVSEDLDRLMDVMLSAKLVPRPLREQGLFRQTKKTQQQSLTRNGNHWKILTQLHRCVFGNQSVLHYRIIFPFFRRSQFFVLTL